MACACGNFRGGRRLDPGPSLRPFGSATSGGKVRAPLVVLADVVALDPLLVYNRLASFNPFTTRPMPGPGKRSTMPKIDFRKSLKGLYSASTKDFALVDVPEFRYLMIDGEGDPNTARSYKDAIETLYPVAYAIKFASKLGLGRDYVVPPLEALWWAADMEDFIGRRKDRWLWTVMLMLPDWIDPEFATTCIEPVRQKKCPPALAKLRIEALHEGRCVQILHVGAYDDEGPVLARMHQDFMPSKNLTFNGRHHEIYLSDARKTPPDKLKTILRQPVRPMPSR